MLGAANQKRETEALDDSGATDSRVTPVVPAPRWMRGLGDEPADPSDLLDDADENQFWDSPPRYSSTNLASLSPATHRAAPSRWHAWSARLLFTTICCAVVVLLVLEVKSFSDRSSRTGESSTLSSSAP